MPHTSHRKKKQMYSKRTQIVDDEGWTRIGTGSVSRSGSGSGSGFTSRGTRVNDDSNDAQITTITQGQITQNQNQTQTLFHSLPSGHGFGLSPSKLKPGVTLTSLQAQFKDIRKRWIASSSGAALRSLLTKEIDIDILNGVDVCVLLGSGSFCGLIDGWIERGEVALYQLACFLSVIDGIEELTNHRPILRAQDPVYNDLDVRFLTELSITQVDSPQGFDHLTSNSFVYAPSAELDVELRSLASDPALALLHSKLDGFWRNTKGEACTSRVHSIRNQPSNLLLHESHHSESQSIDRIEEGLRITEGFKRNRDMFALPDLEVKDSPFWGVYLYSRKVHVEQI